MGPKRKCKGQYSPYVDHKEPARWRKKMDKGRGPGKQKGLTIDEALHALFEQEMGSPDTTEYFTLDTNVQPHRVICVCGSKRIQWALGAEGIGGREAWKIGTGYIPDIPAAWKIGTGYIPDIPADDRRIGCRKCGRIAAHPGRLWEDGLIRFRVVYSE